MKLIPFFSTFALAMTLSLPVVVQAEGKPVGITADLMSVTIAGTEIKRDQDNAATVAADFAKTSRPCPPFCIQPGTIAPGVETIAELEILDYLKKQDGGDKGIMVIDSRTPDWVEKGSIPGAKNIPWTGLEPKEGATTEGISKTMPEEFAGRLKEGKDALDVVEAVAAGKVADVFDYASAKTLVMFCNGMWCGQSPTNIKKLLGMGYPPEKLKWYRGGMQDWAILGLATTKK